MLDENARLHAHDPAFAAMLAYFARAFAGHAAIASLTTPAPPPQVHAAKPPRLSRHRQVQIVRTWFLNRQEQFEGMAPPSEVQDIEDARNEIKGVSRDVIRKHRPIEWQVGRDKKPKSPNS